MTKSIFDKLKSKNIVLIFVLILGISCDKNDSIIISSPSEINNFVLKINEGKILYSVYQGNKKVISQSQLGIKFKNGVSLTNNFKLLSATDKVFDETWEQPWGENKFIRNNYTESIVSFQSNDNFNYETDIIVRVYDDGVAFRYNVKKLANINEVVITDEITEFNIAKNAKSWWIKAYDPNRYEQLYNKSTISEIDTVHTPLTMRFDDETHISIHEASLSNYSSMQIVGTGSKKLHCDLAPWSNGDKVRTTIPFKTPWRTIKITNNAKDLISSNITINSNPPNKLDDVSWIKPSKYIGIWWGMIIGKWTWEEGFRHGATVERSKKYIDFASKNGFDEVLVEGISAGFTGLFPGDTVTTSYTKTTPDFDLFEVQNYAQKKGVSLQAYHETSASTLNYMAQIEDAFSLMKEVGMQKAKIGHVGARMDKVEYHYGQHAVNYYRKVLEIASKYNVAVNFHEPIKDTGERRTYPNMLTREGARGMEYNAWGNGGNPVDHTTILPFTRMLESPMDFTPGIFDLLYENLDFDSKDEIPVKITLIDKGNGYTNIRYKGGESFWQTKPMSMEYKVEDNDTTYIWSITEMMKPGQWDWGIAAHDIESDNNNVWLLELLNLENRSINISKSGKVYGDIKLTIPNQGFDLKNKFRASVNDLKEVGSNVFGKTQRVNTTIAKQLAYYVVLYSPMQMASDFIENYKDQPGLQFIKDVPVDWEISNVLNANIGEYVSIVRKDKNSSDWYLGSITNKVSRDFDFSLDFLEPNKEYIATIYKDGENADWENNPKDLLIEKIKVKSNTTLSLKLASGGGVAVRFNYIE
jgi:alpha-glucosidase